MRLVITSKLVRRGHSYHCSLFIMKFLSKLSSCYGVATIAPAAETTPSTLTPGKQEEVAGNSSHAVLQVPPLGLRKVKSTSKHWKPTLHMISEDNVMVADIEIRSRSVGSEDDKLSANVKAKSRGKVKSTYYGENYW